MPAKKSGDGLEKVVCAGAQGLRFSGPLRGHGRNGWAVVADNVFPRDNVWESRPPMGEIGSLTEEFDSLFYDQANDQLLALAAREDTSLYKIGVSSGTALDATRAYTAAAVLDNRAYALSDDGLRRINAGNTATETSFVPEGLDPQFSQLSGAAGWLTDDAQAGYRVVWGLKRSDNRIELGAPSGRLVVVHPNGHPVATEDVEIFIPVPYAATTANFWQLYRTLASGGDDVDPGDQMTLVYERYLTSSEKSAESITFTDALPEGGGGQKLYTSSDVEGAAQANYPCECIGDTNGFGELAVFAGCMFATNYVPRLFIDLYLLGVLGDVEGVQARDFTGNQGAGNNFATSVSSLDGLAVGMYVEEPVAYPSGTTIVAVVPPSGLTFSSDADAGGSGLTYTAGDKVLVGATTFYAWTSEDSANRRFLVSVDASPGIAIRDTSHSFVYVLNVVFASNGDYFAQYWSGPEDLPGHIRITARDTRVVISGDTVSAGSHGSAWSPNLDTVTDIETNRDNTSILTFSKPGQPTAWPVTNVLSMPYGARPISLLSLRNGLMIATDLGLMRVVGTYGNFVVEEVDRTLVLGRDASSSGAGLVALDNVGYVLATLGLCAFTEVGLKAIVSAPVSAMFENIYRAVEGTPSRLGSSTRYGLVSCPGGYVFAPREGKNGVWARWKVNAAGTVTPKIPAVLHDNLANPQVYMLAEDRVKVLPGYHTVGGWYDESAAVTVNSYDAAAQTVTLASVPSNLAVGDTIAVSPWVATVTAIDGTTITLATPPSASGAGSAQIGYDCNVQLADIGPPQRFYEVAAIGRFGVVTNGPGDSEDYPDGDRGFLAVYGEAWPPSSTPKLVVVPPGNGEITDPVDVRLFAAGIRKRLLGPTIGWRSSDLQVRLEVLVVEFTADTGDTVDAV